MARTSKVSEQTLETVIETKPVIEEKPATKAKTSKKIKQPLDRNEVCIVRSVFDGTLYYVNPRTGATWLWNYGDEQEMTLGDLLGMSGDSRTFLQSPWVIVDTENEEILERLSVKELYENISVVEDMEEFLAQPLIEISKALDLIPKSYKENIATTVTRLIKEEKLYDNRVIRLLEEKLEKELRE